MSKQDVLMGKKDFSVIADSPSGTILGERRKGFFSVIVPVDDTINYVENPAFMAGEYPYSGIGYAGSRTTLHGYTTVNSGGGRSTSLTPDVYPINGGWCNINPTRKDDSGIYYTVTLPAGTYTFSCYVSGIPEHYFFIRVTNNSGVPITEKVKKRGASNWQRLHVTFTAQSAGIYRLYLMREKTEIKINKYFYTSSWVCEDNPFLTLPFNGDTKEKNVVYDNRNIYSWYGNEWTSKSKRTKWACGSGQEVFLKDYGFTLSSINGLGSSGIKHILQSIASGGSVWNTTKIETRQFTLSGTVQGRTLEERMQNESNLDRILSSTNRINMEQPTTLIFTVFNDKNNDYVEGHPLYLYVRYDGGISTSIPNEIGNYRVDLTFTLVDPFIYSSMEHGIYLDDKEVITSPFHHIVFNKDESNNLNKLNINPNGRITGITRSTTGRVFISGKFTNINSVANTKYIAEYVESTNTVASVAIIQDNESASDNYGGDVISLANGKIVFVGAWKSINSIADSHNIAIFDPSTNTWSKVGATGMPDASLHINKIAIDQQGNLYITGLQDDGDTNNIYKFTNSSGLWSSIGTLDSGINITDEMVEGHAILVVNRKIDPDFTVADIYISGLFDGVNSESDTKGLAFYDGESEEWKSLGDSILSLAAATLQTEEEDTFITNDGDTIVVNYGGGFVEDMALGNDGRVYMVGNFVQTDSGLVSPFVIRYNGSQFEAVGLPGKYSYYGNGANAVAVDDSGNIHILMSFSYSDMVPLAKDYLILTGNTWQSGGLYTSPAGASISSDGILYWDSQQRSMWIVSKPGNGKVTFGGDKNIIKNNGESIFPKIKFSGDGQLVSLYNRDTNKMIEFSSYNIQSKEVVTLDLEKLGYEIVKLVSNINGNISGFIGPSSNINFNLIKGENKVGYVLDNKNLSTMCFATWREKYVGIYETINFSKIIK